MDDEPAAWPVQTSSRAQLARRTGLRPVACVLLTLATGLCWLARPSWASALILIVTIVLPGVLVRRVLAVPAHKRAGTDPTARGTALGTFVAARLTAAALLVASCVTEPDLLDRPVWLVATLLLAVAVVAELPTRVLVRRAVPFAARLRAVTDQNWPRLDPGLVFVASSAALVTTVVVRTESANPLWALALVCVCLALLGVTAADALARIRARLRFNARLGEHLGELGPRFLVHWQATVGTEYQLAMWLPTLAAQQEPFVVVLRDPDNFARISALTPAPVILCQSLEQLDDAVVPSLRAAFYVNSAARNVHLARYQSLTHVQLGHGDSDKLASVNPTHRIFDRVFVAGQAAIDRYAEHGVTMPAGSLVIAGRPQLAGLTVGPLPASGGTTVLYAPTCRGLHKDEDYSSLPWGLPIVAALLEHDCTVLFRPHPYTGRSPALSRARSAVIDLLAADAAATGRHHVFGDEAEKHLTTYECFDRADALVTDVSSLATDFLFTGRPLAMVATHGTAQDLRAQAPVSQAAYVIETATLVGSAHDAVAHLLGDDTLAPVRERLRVHYLGPFAAEHYADGFARAFRDVVDGR